MPVEINGRGYKRVSEVCQTEVRIPRQNKAERVGNKEKAHKDDKDQEVLLATRLRKGDATAFEELYHRYFDRIYSLVYYGVGKDHDIAEDIVQETFLAVLKSARKFRGQSKLHTWLCSIAYNKVADFHRRQKRKATRGEQPSSVSNRELEQIQDNDPPILNKIESYETQQVVEQALSSLPLDYRQVLIFKYVDEMPVLEISQIMHKSPKSVEGILTRARKALRDYLNQSEG